MTGRAPSGTYGGIVSATDDMRGIDGVAEAPLDKDWQVRFEKEKQECPIDCGDNSCLCASKRWGMRPNGRCRCFEAGRDYAENRAMARRARLAVAYWRQRALKAEDHR